jgi:hypothetical protein
MNVGLQTIQWLRHLVTCGPVSNRAGPFVVCSGKSCTATCFFSKSFLCPMSVTFHQCSELIFMFKMTLGRKKTGGPSKISGSVAETGGASSQSNTFAFCFVRTQAIQLNAALQLWSHYIVKAPRLGRVGNAVCWCTNNCTVYRTVLIWRHEA